MHPNDLADPQHLLEEIAQRTLPCPTPDLLTGITLCPCGTGEPWPCQDTEVAWLARGLDPAEQVRRRIDDIGHARTASTAEENSQQQGALAPPVIGEEMLSRAWEAFCDAEQRTDDYGAALKAALEAALAGRLAVRLPQPHRTGHSHRLWHADDTRIEAGLVAGRAIVAIDGAERSPDVVRRRAVAMLAAVHCAEQLANPQDTRGGPQ